MDDALTGRYSLEGIDRMLHSPPRLGIVTALYAHRDGLSFVELREACGLTDGNLSRQLRTLEEHAIVEITKSFVGRTPLTVARLAPVGRSRFEEYLDALEALVVDTRAETKKGRKQVSPPAAEPERA
jgi:DNA-binding transcriptional ArsR family regulator